MSIYSASGISMLLSTNAPLWEIRTNSLTRSSILEIGIQSSSANSLSVGVGRPAAIGTLPSITFPFLAEDPNESLISTTVISIAWQVAPTAPTNYFRRVFCLAAIGGGVIWTFPRGLPISTGSSIVLYNFAASALAIIGWVFTKE